MRIMNSCTILISYINYLLLEAITILLYSTTAKVLLTAKNNLECLNSKFCIEGDGYFWRYQFFSTEQSGAISCKGTFCNA